MGPWPALIEAARWAPSPHNVQPWRIRLGGERDGELLIDSTRTLPKEDTTGSFILLTMGMFLRTLEILAAARGLRLTWTQTHPPEWYARAILAARAPTMLPFARMRLDDDPAATPDLDPALIERRMTSRLPLHPDPVPAEAARELSGIARAAGHAFHLVTDAGRIERMLERDATALFHDLNQAGYHDEIVSWFRFSDRSSLRHRDGLDHRCMNTSRVAYWATARMPWLLRLPVSGPLLHRIYRAQLGPVPTIGLLSGPFWNPADAIATGRLLMTFWLTVTQHGLVIHPYGNLVTNADAARWLAEETGVPDVWLVFKIGRSAPPPRSRRRSLEEILIAG
jgi:hypothetical protein